MNKLWRSAQVRKHLVAYLLIIVLGFSWVWATHKKYDGYVFSTGDTAVAEQAIWNTVFTGRLFHQSFLIGNEMNLREHTNIVQFLYLPFYALVPHTLTLFAVIQAFFVLAGIVVYRYTYAKLGTLGAWLATAFFLFHPLTLIQVIGPMHVVAIGGPLFLFLLIAYRERLYKWFLGLTLAMALVSEFVAPTLFLLGVLALWQRRGWKWFLPPMFAGIALQLVAKFYITVGFGSGGYLAEKLRDALALDIPKFDKRLKRIDEWFAPLAWILPFLSRYSILLLPSLAIVLFIIIYGRIAGGAHVFVLIPPILTIIFIELAVRWKDSFKRVLLYSAVMIGLIYSFIHFANRMDFKTSTHTVQLDNAIVMIKDDGSITADSSIGPHVNRRPEFFLPDNRQLTDYVLLKKSKYADKKKKKQPELEKRKQSYRGTVEQSSLYRVVFTEGRVNLYAKKTKIQELLQLTPEQLSELSDEQLQEKWRKLPTPVPHNIFGMPVTS